MQPASIGVASLVGQVVQALVVSTVVVVADELLDALFELSWQVVVVQQDPVFQRLMSTLDLTLCLRMIWSSTNMVHAFCIEPVGQFAGDVTGAIIR